MKERNGKKRVIKISIVTVTLMACMIATGILLMNKNSSSQAEDDKEQAEGNREFSNFPNMSTGSGTLTAGTIDQTIPLSDETLSLLRLEVEEAYVSEGNVVKQGDELYKLTEISYQKAKETLEQEAASAKTGWKEAQLTYKTELVNLNLNYQSERNLKNTASEEYEWESGRLADEVDSAKEKLNEAKSIVANNPSKISDLEDKITTYENKQKTAEQDWEMENKQIKGVRQAAAKAENAYAQAKSDWETAKGMIAYLENYMQNLGQSDLSQIKHLQSNMQNTLSEQEKRMSSAKTEYETKNKALEEAEKSLAEKEKQATTYMEKVNSLHKEWKEKKEELKTAKSELASLEIAYQEAVNRKKTETVALKAKYEESSLTSDQAAGNYNLEKGKLENTLQEAKEAYEKAEEELDAFMEAMGDGRIYAMQDGTVVSVGFVEGRILSPEAPVVSYYDETVLKVTVSVDQSEIHSLAVGDEVTLSIGSTRGRGTTGLIETIETKNATSGVSQVNYNVTIRLDNTDGTYAGGQTATVLFGTNK